MRHRHLKLSFVQFCVCMRSDLRCNQCLKKLQCFLKVVESNYKLISRNTAELGYFQIRCLFGVSIALSADWSVIWCEFELSLLFCCLVLCGAVQNVVVLKILKQRAEPTRSHQGQICYLAQLVLEYSATSLMLWSGFSALSGGMARAKECIVYHMKSCCPLRVSV